MRDFFIILLIIVVGLLLFGYLEYRDFFFGIKKSESERVLAFIKECEDYLEELEDDYAYIVENATRLSYRDRERLPSFKGKIDFFRDNLERLKTTNDDLRITMLMRTCNQVYNTARSRADDLLEKLKR